MSNANAQHILVAASDLIGSRGQERDQANGERSMSRCVAMFNAKYGSCMTEEQGWCFMVFLKHARMVGGSFKEDDYLDAVAYEGLMAESAINIMGTEQNIKKSSTDLFITVPETTLLNGMAIPSFQVGQYACSKGEDGKISVNATSKPWSRINYHDTRKICEESDLKLITELQFLAIAHDVANQDINWTGGKVGKGKLFQGIHKCNVNEAQAGDYESEDAEERRWLQLSNGERIYDLAGNIFTWIFDDVQGDENGIVAKAFAKDSPSIATAPYPSMKKGMGWRPDAGTNWSGVALVRGGCWVSGDDAGAFRLDGDWPDNGSDPVGFRCTK